MLSRPLPIVGLDSSNDCRGCAASCCDPATVGFSSELPLPAGDRDQDALAPNIRAARAIAMDILKTQVQGHTPKTVDGRFHVRGIFIHGERTPENLGFTDVLRGAQVRTIRVLVVLLLDCDAFDRPSGACLRHDTRPTMCQEVSTQECGFSARSFSAVGVDGRRHERSVLLANRSRLLRDAKPDLASAIADFDRRLQESASEVAA